MAEARNAVAVSNGSKRLADAVRAAKIAGASRTDIVVDIREADRARLEIFAEELQPIVDAVPPGDDLFDFALAGGPQPRFWVDGTAHVSMARDRRTYRFLRETRLGRVTLAESTEPQAIVDRVTEYVAERMVERDKALAVDDGFGRRAPERLAPPQHIIGAPLASPSLDEEPLRMPRRSGPAASAGAVIAVSWLMIGIVAGAVLLMGIARLAGAPVF